MKQLTMNAMVETINNGLESGMIKNYYVTSAEKASFNCMEGNVYHVNIKLVTKEGYKDKIIKMVTNSTYIEDFDLWDDEKSLKENFQTWIECI